MSLGCLVCHGMDSPTRSFRSYSASSSDNEGRCAAMVSCLTRRGTTTSGNASNIATSKVAPLSNITNAQGIPGAPRLVRSRAVTRDLVRDWNFDEILLES